VSAFYFLPCLSAFYFLPCLSACSHQAFCTD
jgi:hypothetical protein